MALLKHGVLYLVLCFIDVSFGYKGQQELFRNLEFGIDMDSRSKYLQKYEKCSEESKDKGVKWLGRKLEFCA